jgi:hypothetical protein
MTDYVKSTNFASKDSLAIGNPLKIVKGAEIDAEFNNIATAVTSKADLNSPSLIGVPTAPTASSGTNTTQLATTAFVLVALQAMYPVGSIYTNAGVATNPNTLLGFGTWVSFGEGRVLVGLNSADTAFDTLEETGGSSTSGSTTPLMTASNRELSVPIDGWGTSGGIPGSISAGRLVVGSGSSEINESLESIRAAGGDRSLGVHTHTITGGEHSHTMTPPYITVAMWKRTA